MSLHGTTRLPCSPGAQKSLRQAIAPYAWIWNMTRRQRRATVIGAGVSLLTFAVLLVLFALRDGVVFFHTPAELTAKQIPAGKRIRLGGLVAQGSLKRGRDTAVDFAITDTSDTIPVRYHGALPDLFREGQGVVAEGQFDPSGQFLADT